MFSGERPLGHDHESIVVEVLFRATLTYEILMQILRITVLFIGLLIHGKSIAATVVDTGPPTGLIGYGYSYPINAGYAAEIRLDQTFFITSIKTYMDALDGNLTLVLYETKGVIPDRSKELFSETFFISNTPKKEDWYGLSGLDILLSPGSYWVAFELRTANNNFYEGGIVSEAPLPVLHEAAGYFDFGGEYHPEELSIGLRVEGSPVPIPSTAWLLGSSIISLVGVTRGKLRKKR